MDVVACTEFGPLLSLAGRATALEEARRGAALKVAQTNSGEAARELGVQSCRAALGSVLLPHAPVVSPCTLCLCPSTTMGCTAPPLPHHSTRCAPHPDRPSPSKRPQPPVTARKRAADAEVELKKLLLEAEERKRPKLRAAFVTFNMEEERQNCMVQCPCSE